MIKQQLTAAELKRLAPKLDPKKVAALLKAVDQVATLANELGAIVRPRADGYVVQVTDVGLGVVAFVDKAKE